MKCEYISNEDKSTTTSKLPQQTKVCLSIFFFKVYSMANKNIIICICIYLIEPCQGDNCRLTSIVGSICGILGILLIGILIRWFCLRRKYDNEKINQKISTVKYIGEPPLYTDAISTDETKPNHYGIQSSINDSINSHYYEKIHYNSRS
ncbi:unnamed protein product [Rotaria magnacalcarata]|uniref:Uncharacterized protein n=2 Tax=Rotaria magnacalcarata TaxID=392030 RepID=A0A816B4S8_9BILA|nr:unnamed protein product [Rotaria magnacalcarata]CAF1629999.1 unnamed protein product [Rotaria magnacalcarata]CAF1979329.1 unnamed protein product [Rotaria magnacalcarata]CAF5180525.1 unnamed protein product [Rotaria magnacalcarata]CAF5185930.1 unnamed protein product [Rotaria magnacalcarata]